MVSWRPHHAISISQGARRDPINRFDNSATCTQSGFPRIRRDRRVSVDPATPASGQLTDVDNMGPRVD
jgi:hypothetical protein